VSAKPEPLPVEPREYHQFYRAPAFRWWKPLVAIPLFVVAVVAEIIALVVGLLLVMLAAGQKMPASETDIPPALLFSVNNLAVALALPLAMLVSWLVYRQRPRWLSSISGGFRWRIFWPFLGIAGVGIALATVAQAQLTGGFGELTWTSTSLALILVIVFTTPFQCAAEEYAMRGLLFRSVGSWFANRWVGLVVAIVVNSVAFMFLHGAGDPWLNAFYVVVGVAFSILTWRTGGLEAAVAMHIANNVISEALLPFQPDSLAHIFDRQAGVAGPEVLIQIGVTALVAGLLLWQSSRLGLSRATAPVAAK
jgi:membrane protease YdiL (CAAX protease family)